jgi:hypothetical protein
MNLQLSHHLCNEFPNIWCLAFTDFYYWNAFNPCLELLYNKLFPGKLEKCRAIREELMTQSGPLKENAPPLTSTDDQKKITTLSPSTRKEQLDKENTSRSTGKQGILLTWSYNITIQTIYGHVYLGLIWRINTQWPRGLRHRSWPFCYWDCGFEFRSGHGCLSLCFCVVFSCVSTGLFDGLITCPTTCLNNKIKKPQTRRSRPNLGCTAIRWMDEE